MKHALTTFVACAAGLWTLDVLVQMDMAGELVEPTGFLVGARHLTGLLLTQWQLAVPIAVLALVAGWIRRHLPRSLGIRRESAAALAAGLCGLQILAFSTGEIHLSLKTLLAPAAVVTVCVWLGARWLFGGGDAGLSESLGLVTFSSATVGLGGLAVLRAVRGNPGDAVPAVLCAGLVGLGVLERRLRSGGAATVIRCVPFVLAVGLVLPGLVRSTRYGRTSGPPAETRRPGRSIVLIVLDTVRADRLRLYGGERNTMPFLEQWAAEGAVAERCVSPAGWTSPAHASIFTGRPVSLHGVHYSSEPGVFVTSPPDSLQWLPGILAGVGYECIAVTANRLALPASDVGFHDVLAPHRRRFNYTLGAASDHVLPFVRRLSEGLRWRLHYADARDIVDITLRRIQTGRRPLFLFVNLLDAHSPYDPPEAALSVLGAAAPRAFPRYTNHRKLSAGWAGLPEGKHAYLEDLYDGELRWLDMQLSRFLPVLESALGDSTLFIVTSDHGEDLGEDGVVGHERGLSQRLLHVPLVVRGPGFRGERISGTMSLRRIFDLMSGFGAGAGRDLLGNPDEFGTMAERYPDGSASSRPWVALIEGGFKGIGPSRFGWELQDLEASRFRDGPAVADTAAGRRLRSKVDAYWERYRDRRVPGEHMSKEQIERLRSLGYIR